MNTPTDTQSGLIVASFGRQVIVQDQQAKRHNCRMKGRKLRPVCGDQVQWTPYADDRVDGVVTHIKPRQNELRRPTRRGRDELVAANLHQLVIVFANRPPADPFLTDRYIAAAEHLRIGCTLVKNKVDLDDTPMPWLDELAELGYPVIRTSIKSGVGVDDLKASCLVGNNILVGQSGVGKSSLLNVMIPGIDQDTQEISDSGKFGRHTTSASYLYFLDNDQPGALIDSPGVRDFAPPPLEEEQVPSGFIEIHSAAQSCRFNNCRHENEPGCEVKARASSGEISPRRYTSYLQMLKLMRELKENAGPAGFDGHS